MDVFFVCWGLCDARIYRSLEYVWHLSCRLWEEEVLWHWGLSFRPLPPLALHHCLLWNLTKFNTCYRPVSCYCSKPTFYRPSLCSEKKRWNQWETLRKQTIRFKMIQSFGASRQVRCVMQHISFLWKVLLTFWRLIHLKSKNIVVVFIKNLAAMKALPLKRGSTWAVFKPWQNAHSKSTVTFLIRQT